MRLRAGVHTGEVELRDDDISGIAVHIAARVAAAVRAGEVLVSRIVVDLVAGSGVSFAGMPSRAWPNCRGVRPPSDAPTCANFPGRSNEYALIGQSRMTDADHRRFRKVWGLCRRS